MRVKLQLDLTDELTEYITHNEKLRYYSGLFFTIFSYDGGTTDYDGTKIQILFNNNDGFIPDNEKENVMNILAQRIKNLQVYKTNLEKQLLKIFTIDEINKLTNFVNYCYFFPSASYSSPNPVSEENYASEMLSLFKQRNHFLHPELYVTVDDIKSKSIKELKEWKEREAPSVKDYVIHEDAIRLVIIETNLGIKSIYPFFVSNNKNRQAQIVSYKMPNLETPIKNAFYVTNILHHKEGPLSWFNYNESLEDIPFTTLLGGTTTITITQIFRLFKILLLLLSLILIIILSLYFIKTFSKHYKNKIVNINS
jgi:hypothetical protein